MNDQEFQELKAAFEAADADSSGTLDREEFIKLLRDLGSNLTEAQIDVGFRLVDEDSSGKINLGELRRWWGIVREERQS